MILFSLEKKDQRAFVRLISPFCDGDDDENENVENEDDKNDNEDDEDDDIHGRRKFQTIFLSITQEKVIFFLSFLSIFIHIFIFIFAFFLFFFFFSFLFSIVRVSLLDGNHEKVVGLLPSGGDRRRSKTGDGKIRY